jgi:hypothetical protein
MKFCVQIPMYNVSRFILPVIDNCGPFVDKIFLQWSALPYSDYNASARGKYRNPTPPEIIDSSPWRSKIELIKGEWRNEHDQRNDALDRARAEGFDWMIVQDADEFYTQSDYKKNLDFMAAHPECDFLKAKWMVFWKTTDYVVDHWGEGLLANCENYAVNLRREARFYERRLVNRPAYARVPGLCCHLSFVLSDEEVREKLGTWSHATETRPEVWLERKWHYWTPSTRSLCPVGHRPRFWRIVPFRGEKPASFAAIDTPTLVVRKPPVWLGLWWRLVDYKDLVHLLLGRAWYYTRTGFRSQMVTKA